MKTDVLKEILKEFNVSEDALQKIQAESGKDVTEAKTKLQSQIDTLTGQITDLTGQVTQRDTDLNDLKQKLTDAGQSSSKLSEVQTNLNTLTQKYEADKNEWQTRLSKQNYEFLAKESIAGIEFTSNAAKKEFLNGLLEKNLPIQNDKLIGISEYIDAIKQNDPGVFKTETPPTTPPVTPPIFVPPVSAPAQPPAESKFGFNFTKLREPTNK